MRTFCAGLLMLVVLGVWGIQGARTADDRPGADKSAPDPELEEFARKLGLNFHQRRVILLRLQQDTGKEALEAIASAIKALPSKIDEIRTFEWGSIDGPQDENQGFTHCLVLSFDNAQARAAAAKHAAYQELEQQLRPHLDESIVVDYKPAGRFWRPSRPVLPEHDIQ